MKRHAIAFFGSSENEHGLPVPFFFYCVLVSPLRTDLGYYHIIVVGVSGAAQGVSQVPTLVKATSEEEALVLALKSLKEHPSHKGLHVQEALLLKPVL